MKQPSTKHTRWGKKTERCQFISNIKIGCSEVKRKSKPKLNIFFYPHSFARCKWICTVDRVYKRQLKSAAQRRRNSLSLQILALKLKVGQSLKKRVQDARGWVAWHFAAFVNYHNFIPEFTVSSYISLHLWSWVVLSFCLFCFCFLHLLSKFSLFSMSTSMLPVFILFVICIIFHIFGCSALRSQQYARVAKNICVIKRSVIF